MSFLQHNDYMCVGVSLPRENSYIVGYEPRADSRVVHHMLMFGCPGSVPQNTWWVVIIIMICVSMRCSAKLVKIMLRARTVTR